MADAEQYLLSFDLSEITRNVDELRSSYDSLSQSLSSTITTADRQMSVLHERTDALANKLSTTLQSINSFANGVVGKVESISNSFNKLRSASSGIVKNIKKIESVDFSKVSESTKQGGAASRITAAVSGANLGSAGIGSSVEGQLKDVLEKVKNAQAMAQEAINKADEALGSAEAADEEAETRLGRIAEKIKDRLKAEGFGAKKALMGIASSAGLGNLVGMFSKGGLFSSLIGMIVGGVQFEQRLGAERGEMLNAAEAAGGITEAGVKKGVKWMAAFAEEAQKKMAIPRKEIQGIVSQVANLGIKIDDTLTKNGKNFYDVTNNALTSTLALDKFLNLSSGSTMKNATQMIENYGYSLDTAASKTIQVGLAAQQSGMNIQKFISSVHSGSAALVQYQIDAEDVSQVLRGIQEQYKKMGIDPAKAGAMAATVTSGLASGFANLPMWAEISLGERMFEEQGLKGLAARHKLQDIVIEGQPGDQQNLMLTMMSWAKDIVSNIGDEDQQRYALQAQLGFTPQQAKMILDSLPDIETMTKEGRIDPKKVEEFMNAFKTEGQQLTELQKVQYEIVKSMAKIGQGLLKIAGGILGTLIVGFKSIPATFQAYAMKLTDPEGSDKLFAAIDQSMSTQMGGIASGLDDILVGIEGLGDALKDGSLAVLKETADNLMLAVKADPGNVWKQLGESVEYLEKNQGFLWMAVRDIGESMARGATEMGKGLGVIDPETYKQLQKQLSAFREQTDEQFQAKNRKHSAKTDLPEKSESYKPSVSSGSAKGNKKYVKNPGTISSTDLKNAMAQIKEGA